MQYHEFAPHPALRSYIFSYNIFRGTLDVPAEEAVMHFPSDGGSELIINLGDPVAASVDPESLAPSSASTVIGPISRNLLVKPFGHSVVAIVRFLPGGLSTIFHIPATELSDQNIDCEAVLGSAAKRLVERTGNSHDLTDIVGVFDNFFLKHISSYPNVDIQIQEALKVMAAQGGQISIRKIAENSGLSRRQFERRFVKTVGISPKRFCRIKRFATVFPYHTKFPGHGWADVAAACGYSDQAHLIRECNFFTGRSPETYLNSMKPLEMAFLRINDPMSHLFKTVSHFALTLPCR